MSLSIVIVTSAQPSANPRAVKEATALSDAGYLVTFVYCPLSPWADEFDNELFKKHPEINWVQSGYHPLRQPYLYKYSRIRRKIYEVVFKITGELFSPEKALILFSQELFHTAKKFTADLYIGHNLGALPIVVKLAEQKKVKAGFDLEDYHSGEVPPDSVQYNLVKNCEQTYLPQVDYLTASSEFISEKYEKEYSLKKPATLINAFSKIFAPQNLRHYKEGETLKLFWFSQIIGKNRGVEDVIAAMGRCGKKVNLSLTLLGNCTSEMKSFIYDLVEKNGLSTEQIILITPKPLDEIFSIASEHHIGLALEYTTNINRQICLTNKILSYPLSGLAVIATATMSQKEFLAKYPGMGFTYEESDVAALSNLLTQYSLQPSLVQEQREKALNYALNILNWEHEQKKFLAIISNQIN